MNALRPAGASDLARRWLDAADWDVVGGGSLRRLAGTPGLGRLAWFDGGLGFLTLTAGGDAEDGDDGEVGDPAVAERVAARLAPMLARSLHGRYHVEERGCYRWTAYLAPAADGSIVAAHTTHLDDRWELRVAAVDRSVAGGLLVDLATLVHRLPLADRPDVRPAGSGDAALLRVDDLDRLTALRGRSAEARDLLRGAGWRDDLAASLAAALDGPIVGVEAATGARMPDGAISVGHHHLWLTPAGWSWRVDPDDERPLVTRLGPLDALDALRTPLRWLDPHEARP